jgi:hypothetical protein
VHEYRTNDPDFQAEPLSEWVSSQIERLLTGQATELNCSLAFPFTETSRCIFCDATVANFKLHSGEIFGAQIEIDDQGATRAVVTSPHKCLESERWEEFLHGLEGEAAL